MTNLPDDVVELKPCPFCGGKAHWPEPEVNMPWVGCTECGACIQDEVRWNTRAALEAARYGEMRALLYEAGEFIQPFNRAEDLSDRIDALLSTIGEPNPDSGGV